MYSILNTQGWNVFVFCAWDNALMSRSVLRVCTNLTSGLLQTKTPNKWRQVERSCNETHNFGAFIRPPPVVIASVLGTLPMLCKSPALSRAKTLVHRFVTRGACRTNAWHGPSSYRKVKVWILRLERYREISVESRTGPLRLIVRTEDEGKIGERKDGEEEGKDRRKRA
jgi:hypothetical protein